MKVFGAGFGRTGTTSLKLALERLGVGPVLHAECFNAGPQFPLQGPWFHKANGRPVPWPSLFDGFESAMDWPVAYYWKQIALEYPDAKFVLTHRPSRDWLASFKATILPNIETHFNSPYLNRGWAAVVIGLLTFDMDFSDENLLRCYAKHVANVKGWFAAEGRDRLLVFNVKDGWRPLCNFLEAPVPDMPFPSANDADTFREQSIDVADWFQPTPPSLVVAPLASELKCPPGLRL